MVVEYIEPERELATFERSGWMAAETVQQLLVRARPGRRWIEIEGKPGQGVSCRIHPPVPIARVPRSYVHRGVGEVCPSGETVLLVEEDDRVRKLVCRALQRHGYDVLEAENDEQARRLGEERRAAIHLLLIGAPVPGRDGRPLAELLRSRRPEMRLLYLSSASAAALAGQGVDLAGMPLLQKPFTVEALVRLVRQVLRPEPSA